MMSYTIHPLTAEHWPALTELFGEHGPASRCWCMYWRIGSRYRQRPAASNRADFRAVVEPGPPPGLLAYAGTVAVGWCQLTPRADLPWLDQTWRLKRVDDLPVWSLSCFYVRKGYRQQGVMSALIDAAIQAAREGGAVALEAYPLDAALSSSASSTGYVTTFHRAGFRIVARHAPSRPIMRFTLAPTRADTGAKTD